MLLKVALFTFHGSTFVRAYHNYPGKISHCHPYDHHYHYDSFFVHWQYPEQQWMLIVAMVSVNSKVFNLVFGCTQLSWSMVFAVQANVSERMNIKRVDDDEERLRVMTMMDG